MKVYVQLVQVVVDLTDGEQLGEKKNIQTMSNNSKYQ